MTEHSRSMLIFYAVLAAIFALWIFALVARGGNINPRSGFGGAKGDGKHDDTAAIQRAFDKANGDVVVFTKGTYRVTKTINISGNRDIDIESDPGAIIRFEPVDGYNVCVLVETVGDPLIRRDWRLPGFRGPRIGADYGNEQPGEMIGLKIVATHRGTLRGFTANGFDGAGLWMEHSYRWRVNDTTVHHCGIGVRGAGLNGTTFVGLEGMYNIWGGQDLQSIDGGIFEGNSRSGMKYTEPGGRYSLHNVYFERNNAARIPGGVPDIDCGDPLGPWNPVMVSISGATKFCTEIDQWEVEYPCVRGPVHLSVTGVPRFFNTTKYWLFDLHPWSSFADMTPGHMSIAETFPRAFKRACTSYYRPARQAVGPVQ